MIVTVVLPAYNCAKTLEQTVAEIPTNKVNNIVLVDDCSSDETVTIAKSCGIKHVYRHTQNRGYGGNQKTCYDKALELNSDIVIMLHPDYQYDPQLITKLIHEISSGADIVLASRMKKSKEALKLGMPKYKYYANKLLTVFQNKLFSLSLTEYHTGYRAYTQKALKSSNYKNLSDSFIFDNQILLELISENYQIREIYCPAKYTEDSSSIGLAASLKYGLGVIYFSIKTKLLQLTK